LKPTQIAALQLSLRAAVATGLAVLIARALNFQNPIYAVIAAVLVMDLAPKKTVQLALQRLAGTLLGAAIGAMLSYVLPSGPLAVAVGIAVAMLLMHALHLQEAAKLAGYICGVVVMTQADQPWSYALNRTMETLLGLGMAVLVSLVPKLLRVDVPDDADSR